MKNIGIYGGTFDPIHLGHLIIAETFAEKCGLDKVFFVPTKKSPFKVDIQNFFKDSERIELIKLSIANNPIFEVEEYEIKNTNISYTIDTINYFQQKYPESTLFLLIGNDNVLEFHRWKDYDSILSKARLVVAQRGSNDPEIDNELLKKYSLTLLNNPLIGISSSDIRNRIRHQLSIRYLVTDEAKKFIEQRKYDD